MFGEGGAAARTVEVQLGAALADLLQRLCELILILIRSTSHVIIIIIIIIIIRHPKHFSRPAELVRLTATPCCAAAAPWPAQRSKTGGVQANAPLAEAGHLAIRCVRRSSPCVHGRRYAEPQGAAERILRGAVRGMQRCREVHRQACTRAAPKRGGAIKRRAAPGCGGEVLHCPGCRWCGRCQFEALRGSSGGDAEARGQAQGRAPARWLCMSLGPRVLSCTPWWQESERVGTHGESYG